MNRIWAGIDSGQTHHQCLVLDDSGATPLSRSVANDEPELLKLLAAVLALGDQVTWAVDMVGSTATEARARPTPATRSSSLTRLGSAAISRNPRPNDEATLELLHVRPDELALRPQLPDV
jgi:hypothetical protein